MRLIYLILPFFTLIYTFSQNVQQFENNIFVNGNDTIQYRILYPEKIKTGKKHPLVLFLHGAGERGSDNKRQLTHGARLFLNEQNQKKYPAIVVFPQCPQGIMWTNRQKHKNENGEWLFDFPIDKQSPWPALLVDHLVSELIDNDLVDSRRVYIMGLSMGGIGTLEFLYRNPDKYAGAVVICGGHNPELSTVYQDIPIWFFHGGKDNVVPMQYSQEVYNSVKSHNKKTKYTLYPEANHNSWDPAFTETDLLKWLFSNKRRK